MLPYKVSKRYSRGSEQEIARFNRQADATDFIKMVFDRDAGLKENASYLLYETGELLEEFTAESLGAGSTGQSSQQQTSRQTFSPSPLQTMPRPSGMPPSSFRDAQEEEKKK